MSSTPGDPLEHEDLTTEGSMNPGAEAPQHRKVEDRGRYATPGNPLTHEDLRRPGSMNPGPHEDAEGHIER